MNSHMKARKEFRKYNRSKRKQDPLSMVVESFNVWFPATMQQDITDGNDMHKEEEATDGKDGEGNEEVYY
jgi:hypothetical protein